MCKLIIIYIALLAILSGCREDWQIPNTNCSAMANDSSSSNPKALAFQRSIDYGVQKGIPGIVALVRTPENGLWIGSAGKAKIETGEPMLTCNIHHSASVAKMYIAVATMLLAEDGEISLDDPINKYIDKQICNRIGNGNTATIRQLMNHTSGIRDFVEHPQHITEYFNNLFRKFTTIDYLKFIYDEDANFTAGTKAAYSNTNYVLLTLVIDNVTNNNHAAFISERILKKLGLHHTYYKNEGGYPNPPGLVNSYFDRYGDGRLENFTEVAIHFDAMNVGHDAMLASAEDFGKFIDALYHGKIVNEQSLKEMQEWKTGDNPNMQFGLGMIKERAASGGYTLGHDGANLGVAMRALYYPEHDATIIICSNICGFFDSPALDVLNGIDNALERTAFR